MRVFGIVYLMKNVVNGKVYIGVTTTNLQHRVNLHFKVARESNPKRIKLFQQAILKYGIDKFEAFEVCVCADRVSLFDAEKALISAYQSNNGKFGYNLTNGGAGVVGFDWTPAQKKAFSEKLSGGKHPLCALTIRDLQKMKELLKTNSIKATAEEMGVSRETVRGIVSGRTYKGCGVDFTDVQYKSKTTSRHKGVSFSRFLNKWVVTIKAKRIGFYNDESTAIEVAKSVLSAPEPELR